MILDTSSDVDSGASCDVYTHPHPPGVREGADEDVGLLTPRRVAQLPPVQLQLLAGLVGDLCAALVDLVKR